MKILPALALLLLPCTALSMEAVQGVARLADSGKEVYVEQHFIDSRSHRIEYRDTAGQLIAESSLDYSRSNAAPDFLQRDLRFGTELGGRWSGETYELFYSNDARPVEPDAPLVASSGFDRFVRENWDNLAAGERIDIDFAVPTRLDTLRLRIERETSTDDDGLIWFRISAANGLLRLILDPIELAYDRDRRLQVYRGLSNLDSSDRKAQQVEIRYRYCPDFIEGCPGLASDDDRERPEPKT